MEIVIGIKGENGKLVHLEGYTMEEAEIIRLKDEFVNHLAFSSAAKGGVYKCTFGEQATAKWLFLKFEEIVYIG